MERIANRVSCIIPVYNCSAYLKEALESVLTQSYSDIEVIVIDDGSSDRSFEIASSYPDRRVRTIQQANGGPSSARNTGFRHSTGEFIWYLDADDVLVNGSVERLVVELKESVESAFAVGAWRNIDEEGRVISEVNHFRATASLDETYTSMLLRTPFPPSAALFRASVVAASGGWDETLWCAEDRDFYLRVLEANFKFKSTDSDVFRYRIHESNATFNTERIQTHANRFLKKWFGPHGRANENFRSLAPLAKAIVDLYIARQCMITNQSNQVMQFTESAAEALLLAQTDAREATLLLWETTTNPHQKLVRVSLWTQRPDVVSEYCQRQAKVALRAGKPRKALMWLSERILCRARAFLMSFGKPPAVAMANKKVGQP